MHDAQPKDAYTIDEAARELKVSVDTIRRWIRQGRINAQKRPPIGETETKKERWYIPKEAVKGREGFRESIQEVADVVPVRPDITLPALANAIELAVGQRDEQIIQRIAELFEQQNKQLTDALTEQSTRQNEVIQEQKALIEQLTADVVALKEERERKKGFFARLRGH